MNMSQPIFVTTQTPATRIRFMWYGKVDLPLLLSSPMHKLIVLFLVPF